MEEKSINVHYVIGEKLSVIPTKMVYEKIKEDMIRNIHYELILEDNYYKSSPADDNEYAVANLQRALPLNVRIVCCQSCRHGNFGPFGGYHIYCLKDNTPSNKRDVCDFFSEKINVLNTIIRPLLGYCKKYNPISEEGYYTYNDWKWRT